MACALVGHDLHHGDAVPGQAFECHVAVSQVAIERERVRDERPNPLHEHHPVGIADRQGCQHQRVHHAEHDRVRAHTERDRDGRRRGKAGGPKDGAKRITDVTPQVLQEAHPESITVFLLDLFQPAELELHAPPRFVSVHPVAGVPLDLPVQMEAQFLVELVFDARANQERTQPATQVSPHGGLRYVASSTWPMAAVSRRHASVCASSCERPFRVSS
jgi:hypothetical protein